VPLIITGALSSIQFALANDVINPDDGEGSICSESGFRFCGEIFLRWPTITCKIERVLGKEDAILGRTAGHHNKMS
jgi:hypothetical protein